MSVKLIGPPQEVFYDDNGTPLDGGFIYIGEANQNPETNPIAIYWDAALTQPAAQPVRTTNGYPSNNGTAGKLYAASEYSITIRDWAKNLVFTSRSSSSGNVTFPISKADAEALGDTSGIDVLIVWDGSHVWNLEKDAGGTFLTSADGQNWAAVDWPYYPRPVTAPAIVKNVGDWQRRHRDLLDFTPAATPSDWSPVLQTAWNEMAASGGKLSVTGGAHVLDSEVDFDQSLFLNYGQNLQVVVEGDGSSNTAFIVNHSGAGINIFGGTLGVPRTTIRGLKFRGSGLRNGIGIIGDNLAHCAFEDLLFNNLDVGFEFTDLLSSVFYNIQSKWNNYGGRFNGRVNLSPHNAIDMFRCQFGNNSEYGLYAKNIAVFNFFGGSIEGNGITGLGATGQRFGMKIEEPNANGDMPALNMNGTWFEHNAGTADLFVLTADAGQYSQWNIERCLFTRVTSAEFVDYPIRFDLPVGAGHAHVEAHGNSFAGYGTYVPDAARPYIKTFISGGSISFAGRNHFQSDVEAPVEFATNQVHARCAFNGTLASPLVVRGNNVASITKNATGDYTITFNKASNFPTKSLAVTLNGQGVGYKFAASASTVRIRTADLAGTLTDFSDITVIVWD